MTVLASCDSEEGRVTGTWQGRRFGTDVRTLTLEDSHGRLSGSCGAARSPSATVQSMCSWEQEATLAAFARMQP